MKVLTAATAIGIGVGGVLALFWALNALTGRLPRPWRRRLRPAVFVGPALLVVGVYLLFPIVDTLRRSFLDATGTRFVGLENYHWLATDQGIRQALGTTMQWIVVVPVACLTVGLAMAFLADRLAPFWERSAKSVIFLPMAISFVGAGTIWQFMYAWRPEGTPQIGLLNAVWTGFGGSPVAWVREQPVNNLALMLILIWLESGFAMVLLSAAIKNVPAETLDSARIDGASELHVFWHVVLPQIRSTMVVVGTTTLVLVLKVFDIVFVMTGGRDGTDVLAHRFIVEFVTYGQGGRAAVMVVFLILVIVPFVVLNIRHFRHQEATR